MGRVVLFMCVLNGRTFVSANDLFWRIGEWMRGGMSHHGKTEDSILLHQRAGERCVRPEHVFPVLFVAEAGLLVAVDGEA